MKSRGRLKKREIRQQRKAKQQFRDNRSDSEFLETRHSGEKSRNGISENAPASSAPQSFRVPLPSGPTASDRSAVPDTFSQSQGIGTTDERI